MNFRRSIFTAELWRSEVARRLKVSFFAFFLEKRSLTGNFQNSVSKGVIMTSIDVLSSNFAKYGRLEIGKIVCCLHDKKPNFAWLSSSRYCADQAQNLPQPAPDNVLRILQISSKSVHFRRSYRVISERVNTIRSLLKVNPIFGEA